MLRISYANTLQRQAPQTLVEEMEAEASSKARSKTVRKRSEDISTQKGSKSQKTKTKVVARQDDVSN